MKMILPKDFSVEDRKRMAEDLFRKGYNCCQSVLLTFADVLELNKLASAKVLAVIGSGFGGGMARMREVCGSFSAAVCLSGFISPANDPDVKDARKNNYALVQEFAETFKEKNGGSIICRELLGLDRRIKEGPTPSVRSEEFYRKRPCPGIISETAGMVAEKFIELAGKDETPQREYYFF